MSSSCGWVGSGGELTVRAGRSNITGRVTLLSDSAIEACFATAGESPGTSDAGLREMPRIGGRHQLVLSPEMWADTVSVKARAVARRDVAAGSALVRFELEVPGQLSLVRGVLPSSTREEQDRQRWLGQKAHELSAADPTLTRDQAEQIAEVVGGVLPSRLPGEAPLRARSEGLESRMAFRVDLTRHPTSAIIVTDSERVEVTLKDLSATGAGVAVPASLEALLAQAQQVELTLLDIDEQGDLALRASIPLRHVDEESQVLYGVRFDLSEHEVGADRRLNGYLIRCQAEERIGHLETVD